jgi:hypothetical protein
LLCGAVKLLRNYRAKPDQVIFFLLPASFFADFLIGLRITFYSVEALKFSAYKVLGQAFSSSLKGKKKKCDCFKKFLCIQTSNLKKKKYSQNWEIKSKFSIFLGRLSLFDVSGQMPRAPLRQQRVCHRRILVSIL